MLNRDHTKIDPTLWGLAAVLVWNAFFKWQYFSGLALADDFTYGVYAFSLFRGGYSWDMTMDFRALRLSLLLPVAILLELFPPAELVVVLYPTLLSFGTVVLVYLIGKRVAGSFAGVCGAAMISLYPLEARYGTMLMPDVVVPFFVTLAVYLFLREKDTKEQNRPLMWYLTSGVAWFLAFNCRENTYYFALFYLPFAFKQARWRKGFWGVAAGFAVPVVLLYLFYLMKTGDFLYNLHLAERYRDPLVASGYIPSNSILWIANVYFMFPGLFYKLTGNPGFIDGVFGITFTLGVPLLIAATIRAAVKKDWRFLVIPWWFLAGYLFLEYGSISFTEYQMMKKLPRFLLIITPALAIAGGVVVADVLRWVIKRWKRRHHGPVLFGATGIVSVLFAGIVYVFIGVLAMAHANDDTQMAKFRWAGYEVLKNLPRKPVYQTGGWWPNKLSWYLLPDERFIDLQWRRSNMIRDLMGVNDPTELGDSYVIIDRSHFTGENSLQVTHSYGSFPGYVQAPPDDWQLVGAGHSVEIYAVPAGFDYSEPDGKTQALAAFTHAIEIRDLLLAIYAMHPDFVQSLTEETFISFMGVMVGPESPERTRLFETVTYRQYNGRWKLLFHLESQ